MTMAGTARSRETSGASTTSTLFGTDLSQTALPARGLVYSVILHVLVAFTVLYVPLSNWLPKPAHLVTTQAMLQQHQVLQLPRLEPTGSSGPTAPSNRGGEEEALRSSPEAKTVRGVLYKGPQVIVTNPANPDNFVQTIRQPAFANVKLPTPLALPPMVTVAALALPAPVATPTLPVQAAMPQPLTLPPQLVKVEIPKLALPTANPAESLSGASASAAVPDVAPSPVRPSPTQKAANQPKNILVLDAIPIPGQKPTVLPPGELYGTFTISPEGITDAGKAGGGVQSKGAPGVGSTSGSITVQYAENGGKASFGSSEGNPGMTGAGPGVTPGHGGSGKGTATGDGSGARAAGSGRGASGMGTGSSPFPAIMIQGGVGNNAGGMAMAGNAGDSKPQASYGMTIVASGASGGGFKDFGVFRNEASYTVYLDMADAGARGASWAMQYALDRNRASQPLDSAPSARGVLVPPYAMSKSLPHLHARSVNRGQGGTIVVFGVISPQGFFEDLQVMQSSNENLNKPLLDSLVTWAFRPAEIDGAKVAVKVLLGVNVDSLPN